MKQEKFILSMLVKNESGVLTRVSGLFARRGFNIDSLSVGETADSTVSRITITTTGDEYIKDQIKLQLEKLHDVIIIESMVMENTIKRELLLIKVKVEQGKRSEILEATTIFKAKVVDLTKETLTVEITGDTAKCSAFLEYMRPFGIVELCRTGITAISRGNDILTNNKNPENQE